MKIFKRIYIAILLAASLVACQEDLPELGSLMPKEDLEFSITQNPDDPNMVILESLTPKVIPQWITPMGRSTRVKDTVLLPFSGTYKFVYGVQGAGGYVSADTFELEITTINLSYVDDPLWNALTGGVGNEKSWLLDTDAKYFSGPLSFFGTNNGWLYAGNAFDGGEAGCYGEDCWTWSPDTTWLYSNNVVTRANHGVMTFSLDGGAAFSAVKPLEGGIEESGTYSLSTSGKTLRINDASILRSYKPDKNGLTGISDWSNYVLFDLDENILRLGVIRDNDVDGEGAAMLVYNFISKEYADNWVPEEEEEPEADEGFMPVFEPGELLEILTGGKSSGRVWKLDGEGNPIDWLASGIGWTSSAGDSYNWGWNDAWAEAAGNSWIRFDQFNGSQTYTLSQNGVETSSTFTIDEETNEITLGGTNTLILDGGNGSWMNPTTNVITVVKGFPESYDENGIWFGTSYDSSKDEWLVFHYIIP